MVLQQQDGTSYFNKTYHLTLAEIGIHVLTVSYLLIIQILLTIPRLVYIQ